MIQSYIHNRGLSAVMDTDRTLLSSAEFVSVDRLSFYDDTQQGGDEWYINQVAELMDEFGWRAPLLVTDDDEILIGAVRYQAAVELGLDRIPVIYVDDIPELPESDLMDAKRLAENTTE